MHAADRRGHAGGQPAPVERCSRAPLNRPGRGRPETASWPGRSAVQHRLLRARSDPNTASSTTPTIWIDIRRGGCPTVEVIVRPSGLAPFRNLRANVRLASATRGVPARSRSVTSRPSTTRVPNALNHPGAMRLTGVIRSIPRNWTPPEIVSTGRSEIVSTGGVWDETAAPATPGTARTASVARS